MRPQNIITWTPGYEAYTIYILLHTTYSEHFTNMRYMPSAWKPTGGMQLNGQILKYRWMILCPPLCPLFAISSVISWSFREEPNKA